MAPQRLQLQRAVKALASGGVIAYPTESVWGLGCEPLDGYAVARLLRLKQRLMGKGVILIASTFSQLRPYLGRVAPSKMQAAVRSWPGPNTWIVPAAPGVPDWLTGGRSTLAVRVTAHPVAAALCNAYGGAVVSTSANVSSRPPARTALQVRRRFGTSIDALLPGPTGGDARPTVIRDLASGKVLRR